MRCLAGQTASCRCVAQPLQGMTAPESCFIFYVMHASMHACVHASLLSECTQRQAPLQRVLTAAKHKRVNKFRTCQQECMSVYHVTGMLQRTPLKHRASQRVHLHTHPLWATSLDSRHERNGRSSSEPSCCGPRRDLFDTQAHVSVTPRSHQHDINLGGGQVVRGEGGGRGVGGPCT